MKKFLCYSLCLASLAGIAEKQPYEHYQSIVDRQMFGPLPPGFDPTKRPNEVQKTSTSTERELTKEQEQLKSSIRFFALDVRPSGEIVVGFSDNADPKAPRIYSLKVGDSRDGWTVKEADAEAATMTIVKDEVEVSLKLGGDSSKDGASTARSASSAASKEARPSGARGLLGGRSLGAMRRRRQEEDETKRAQAAEKEAERQAQAEQEKQQRDAERAEQRQQLLAIQEELKRVREAKTAATADEKETNAGDQAQ